MGDNERSGVLGNDPADWDDWAERSTYEQASENPATTDEIEREKEEDEESRS